MIWKVLSSHQHRQIQHQTLQWRGEDWPIQNPRSPWIGARWRYRSNVLPQRRKRKYRPGGKALKLLGPETLRQAMKLTGTNPSCPHMFCPAFKFKTWLNYFKYFKYVQITDLRIIKRSLTTKLPVEYLTFFICGRKRKISSIFILNWKGFTSFPSGFNWKCRNNFLLSTKHLK